jgi:hypothetical protein
MHNQTQKPPKQFRTFFATSRNAAVRGQPDNISSYQSLSLFFCSISFAMFLQYYTYFSQVRNVTAELLIFFWHGGGEGEKSLEVRYEDKSFWLTQKMTATLFDVTIPAMSFSLWGLVLVVLCPQVPLNDPKFALSASALSKEIRAEQLISKVNDLNFVLHFRTRYRRYHARS